jgi:hypothetical protein
LSLCQGNQAIRCIKRLGYCVSFHAAFGHRSTSNESLLPTAFYHEKENFS